MSTLSQIKIKQLVSGAVEAITKIQEASQPQQENEQQSKPTETEGRNPNQ